MINDFNLEFIIAAVEKASLEKTIIIFVRVEIFFKPD